MPGKFTKEDLKSYNGQNGKPAYIAYKGKVYDVTDGPSWGGGDHFGEHEAGLDLTYFMGDASHGDEVFAGIPVVGEYVG